MRSQEKDERPEVVGLVTAWCEHMNRGTPVRTFVRTMHPPRPWRVAQPINLPVYTAATNTFGSLNAGLSRKAARSTVPMR